MKTLVFTLLFFSAFTFYSCTEMPADWRDMNIEDIAREINNEVAEAGAQHISECKILPIGVKPCGSHRGYLIFSNSESSESKLSALVSLYNDLDKERIVTERTVSVCDVAIEPPLELIEGKCRGMNLYAWNPGDILRMNGLE